MPISAQIRKISLIVFFFFASAFLFCLDPIPARAGELVGVTMPDQAEVEGLPLVLNGMGLREVYRFGIPVKVYVAGLYLQKKNTDSYSIVKNDEVKRLVMHFVRPVDREALVDAFRKGYEDSCFLECAKKGEQFRFFAENVVSVRKGNEIVLTFYKDKIEIKTNGPNAKQKMIENPELSRNMMALFINKEKPPGQEFRKGLLGLR